MKYYYDLHIHSVLSPCGDYLMTPNNILNMATLTNLNIIAITDHNTILQANTFRMLESSYDLLLISGCEIQVEGGHFLVYFKCFEDALAFQKVLDELVKKQEYDTEYYGEQIIMNEYDIELKIYPYYLVDDLQISFDELLLILNDYDCLKVIAHIDKPTTSLLNVVKKRHSQYIDAIEIINSDNLDKIYEKVPFLKTKTVLFNSDAHNIIQIDDSKNYLELTSLEIENVFEVIKNE